MYMLYILHCKKKKDVKKLDMILVLCGYLSLVSFLPDRVGHLAHTETTGWQILVRGRRAQDVCRFLRNKLERVIRVIFLAIGLHGVRVPHAGSCSFSWTFSLPDPSDPLSLLRVASSPLSGHFSVHYTSEAGTLKRSAYQWTFAQCCI